MEDRYRLLAQTGVRHVSSFNELGEETIRERLGTKIATMDEVPTHMPYIVIVADELADLMMTAGKDVEQHIIRLAAKESCRRDSLGTGDTKANGGCDYRFD